MQQPPIESSVGSDPVHSAVTLPYSSILDAGVEESRGGESGIEVSTSGVSEVEEFSYSENSDYSEGFSEAQMELDIDRKSVV